MHTFSVRCSGFAVCVNDCLFLSFLASAVSGVVLVPEDPKQSRHPLARLRRCSALDDEATGRPKDIMFVLRGADVDVGSPTGEGSAGSACSLSTPPRPRFERFGQGLAPVHRLGARGGAARCRCCVAWLFQRRRVVSLEHRQRRSTAAPAFAHQGRAVRSQGDAGGDGRGQTLDRSGNCARRCGFDEDRAVARAARQRHRAVPDGSQTITDVAKTHHVAPEAITRHS